MKWQNTEKQWKDMSATSLQKLSSVEVGQNILVKDLYVDSGWERNVSCSFKCMFTRLVLIYQIHTKKGIIKYTMDERHGFIFCGFELH